ncbi:MAG: guanylate kinase [Candidatus Muirbacterium halophilum]|nr:guanylate kinase [Candidatus Muirbacterium halophilum]MCK9475814.1 guanylate kinase [Candidatus Muirbacterium halophilum]
MNKSKGMIIVISGPSGAGKTTLSNRLVKEFDDIEFSVSSTTRNPRSNETDKAEYDFISIDEFKRMVAENEFAEWADVHGNYYGTKKQSLKNALENGKNILLEVDVQGGLQIKGQFPYDTVMIFIAPPDHTELQRRLVTRNTDSDEVIEKRLFNSLKEMLYIDNYEYFIVNDNVERAYKILKRIIKTERYKSCRRVYKF